MGYSYQDLDTRTRVLEDKVEFLLKMVYMNVNFPEGPKMVSGTELYRLQQAAGVTLTPSIEAKDGGN